jgi:CCR4-NOT transcription complex subunit 1
MFFRLCMEIGIDSYMKHKTNTQATPAIAYQAIDAYAKLIVLLVKYYNDPESLNHAAAKINYFTKVISLIVVMIAQAHEHRRQNFNPKPFFRFFSSLLNDLNSYESQLQPIYFQLLSVLR